MVGDSSVTQYADDITIVTSFQMTNPSNVSSVMGEEIQNFARWCLRNKQRHNHDKTQLLFFNRSTNNPIPLASLPIRPTPVMKILGIFLNAELTWHDHVSELCKKGSRRLRILRVMKPHVSERELHTVYASIVLSIFEYACPLFVSLEALELIE